MVTKTQAALVFVSSILINLLADMIHVSAPIVIISSLTVLMITVAWTPHDRTAASASGQAVLSADWQFVPFCLASLLLGALIGLIAVLPVFEAQYYTTPRGIFTSYELGAEAVILILACIPILRRRPILLVSAFLVSATTGMTLAIVTVQPENNFLETFFNWLTVSAIVATAVYLMVNLGILFEGFWWGRIADDTGPKPQTSSAAPPPQGVHRTIDLTTDDPPTVRRVAEGEAAALSDEASGPPDSL